MIHQINVLQGIATHRDDVRQFSRYQGTQILIAAQDLGGIQRRSLDRLQRRHAGLDHVAEFHGVLPMGEDTGIGAERDFYAVLVGGGEGLLNLGSDRRGLDADDFREIAGLFGLFCHPLAGRQRRYVPGAVFLH